MHLPVPDAVCRICNGKEHANLVGHAPLIDPQSSEIVAIVTCGACQHWWTLPSPSQQEVTQMYSAGDPRVIGSGWDDCTTQSANSCSLATGHWVQQFLRMSDITPGTCLEVGPGDGSLMRTLTRDGWECVGIEPGPWLEDESIFSSIDDLPEGFKVDILILHDVLEHMVEPDFELERACLRLKEGGLIFAAFPYADSLEARTLGSQWPMVRPFGHLHYFSRKSAELLFDQVGAPLIHIDVARVLSRQAALLQLLKRPLSAIYGAIRHHSFREFFRRLSLVRSDLVGFVSRGDQLHVVALKRQSSL